MLEKISLRKFRNISKLDLEFTSGINLIIAPNGTGKTNILEAIFLSTRGTSPRTHSDLDLIPLNRQLDSKISEFTRISAQMHEETYPKEIILGISPDSQADKPGIKKTYRVSEKSTTKKNFAQGPQAVFFSPESIGLLTDGLASRRQLFDNLLDITDFEYPDLLTRYSKSLRNRNILLRKLQTSGKPDELLFWTREILDTGSKITQKRWEMLGRYSTLLSKVSQKIFDNQWIGLSYHPHIDSTPIDDPSDIRQQFLEDLKRLKNTEISAGKTLKGPHRDKWILSLDDKDLSRFGSRGEQRLGVLAVFLAFLEEIDIQAVSSPLLLLDDVTSELDTNHISLLIQNLKQNKFQTFLTTTQKEIAMQFENEAGNTHVIDLGQIL